MLFKLTRFLSATRWAGGGTPSSCCRADAAGCPSNSERRTRHKCTSAKKDVTYVANKSDNVTNNKCYKNIQKRLK